MRAIIRIIIEPMIYCQLARQAIEAGATSEEITEVLRVAQHLSGVGCIYTAGQALKELVEERK